MRGRSQGAEGAVLAAVQDSALVGWASISYISHSHAAVGGSWCKMCPFICANSFQLCTLRSVTSFKSQAFTMSWCVLSCLCEVEITEKASLSLKEPEGASI